jgi:ABC-type polysaccharide/polyol phosphate transport system ATPase subunit
MDTAVKYYSAGMRMRLGFAIATSVEPDILLLDEILAVGDAAFRERCLKRLASFQASGATVVLATHDVEAACAVASRALWLEAGRVRRMGNVQQVVSEYVASFEEERPSAPPCDA